MRGMTLSRLARWLGWGTLLVIVLATLSPLHLRPTVASAAGVERLLAFAGCAAAFWLGYPRHRPAIVLGILLAAGLLEVTQNLLPDRHGRLVDALVKMLGAGMGFVAGFAVERVLRPGASR
ncbi:VanZ family protein [Salinarimonas soli]|uniref:VanZ family protein n=1 Tax=Salinarimonas soli TaxID=1638099 RepID=A0A5B2VST4_9HYPH|nr:VanZ family protein [Salinarimonas soli]KAA2241169.1 VanZ family protein [Salinarimonas soli]